MSILRVGIRFDVDTSDANKATGSLTASLGDLLKGFLAFKAVEAVWEGLGNAISGVTQYLDESVQSAREFESQMMAVRSTTGMSMEAITKMGDSFKRMSIDTGVAASDLASLAEVAGSLGIAQGDIQGFVDLMSKGAIAMPDFSGGAAELATAMAKLKNLFGLTVTETGYLMNSINTMADATAATAPQVTAFMSAFTGAKNLGIAAQDAVALGSAMISLGQDPSDAATRLTAAISGMLGKTSEAATATGLSRDELLKWATQAGLTKDEALKIKQGTDGAAGAFRALADQDIMLALQAVVNGLGNIKSSTELNQTATEIFGMVGGRAIQSLVGNWGQVTAAQEESNAAWGNTNKIEEEFNIKSESSQGILNKLTNAYAALSTTIGELFMPWMDQVNRVLTDVVSSLWKMVQRGKEAFDQFRETKVWEDLEYAVFSLGESLKQLIAGFEMDKKEWTAFFTWITKGITGLVTEITEIINTFNKVGWDQAWEGIRYTVIYYMYEIWDDIVAWWAEIEPKFVDAAVKAGEAVAKSLWESFKKQWSFQIPSNWSQFFFGKDESFFGFGGYNAEEEYQRWYDYYEKHQGGSSGGYPPGGAPSDDGKYAGDWGGYGSSARFRAAVASVPMGGGVTSIQISAIDGPSVARFVPRLVREIELARQLGRV